MMKTPSRDDILQPIRAVLRKYTDEVVAVYLFGSWAKGDAAQLSDVDIAILAEERDHANLFDLRVRLYADLCRALKRNDIDLLILNTASNLIIKDEIVRNGIVIFDNNPPARQAFEVNVIHSCIDFMQQRRKAVGC